MKFAISTGAATMASMCASVASAQLHYGDIILQVDASGHIETIGSDDATGEIFGPQRVFGTDLDIAPYFTNEPGMDSLDGTFSPASQVGFRIRAALRLWDGSTFNTLARERLSVQLATLGPVLTPLTDTVVDGFSMLVNSTGKFHHHPGFTLTPGQGQDVPGDGVYLYQAELYSNDPAVHDSLPFWIVFNENMPLETRQAAENWVHRRYVCPADFNIDGVADFFDYLDFVSDFSQLDSDADVNDDGVVDFFDYLDFVQGFAEGCN